MAITVGYVRQPEGRYAKITISTGKYMYILFKTSISILQIHVAAKQKDR